MPNANPFIRSNEQRELLRQLLAFLTESSVLTQSLDTSSPDDTAVSVVMEPLLTSMCQYVSLY